MAKKPVVNLNNVDGNAFSVMGAVSRQARNQGWKQDQIDALLEEMMAGDYDHLLATIGKHFEVQFGTKREREYEETETEFD